MKHILLALILLAASIKHVYAVARTCYKYTTVYMTCRYNAASVCVGTCSKYQFPAGTGTCGYCTESWFGSCTDAPIWYVTLDDMVAPCIVVPVGIDPPVYDCAGCGTFTKTGTSVNGCTCL